MMKTALVTGGAGGIGAAVAHRLALDGCRVAVHYHSREPARDPAVLERGGMYVQADVSDSAQVEQMMETVVATFCQLDILVCNAGVAWQGLTQDMSDEDYRRVMGTDLDGVFFCCRAALPHMISRKAGKIITVASMWGQVGGACETAYSAAKAGVIGLTRALAKEVGPSSITVNCVSPGVIDTPMNAGLGGETLQELAGETPLGRLGRPEDVAGCVSFLCSRDGDFLTGQVLSPNGGWVM